ncbi:elongator complex protein 1 isoform X2 [Amyelois transitella]|uniref:elongator complex protein 1 isoform X2 n=1 Tax=Amyelois transitella TaxID=680683 RepID=UPI00067B3E6D|nr:elongator complex protein 1 isoform X2 [Amyelois transitella]
MKNLDIWEVSLRNLKIELGEVCCVSYGHDEIDSSGDLYICSHNLIVTDFGENGEVKWSKDLSDLASSGDSPVNVTFLAVTNALCVGLQNGELFTISNQGDICELAGVCENGLLAMEWSPDQELLTLVTKDLKTILMTCTFDAINEVNLLSEEFGEKQFITVGWGKKETQFHGSEGKQAAKAIVEVNPDRNLQSDQMVNVKITWRGDSQLYAIGFINNGIWQFKVFDREGQLQYTSEKQPGLESNLSWRPSGNVIATTQRLQDKYVVAFFEKNGLKHGEFTIPVDDKTQVEDLVWSSDSEILALLCRDEQTNIQKILLFTTGNYHWYLKQTLEFNSDQNLSKMLWDNDFDIYNNKKLHVILSNGQYYSYSWIWNIEHSKGTTDLDDAVVTVIDGKKVLVTGFRQTVVPPPMSALELKCNSFINSTHFAPGLSEKNINTNTFFVCTSNNKLIFYKQTQKFPLLCKQIKIYKVDKNDFPFQYYNWYWWKPDTIVSVMLDSDGCYNLVEWQLVDNSIVKKTMSSLPAALTRIQAHPKDTNVLFLQLNNGEITKYEEGKIDILEVSFPVACPKFSVLSILDTLYFLGLSHKGHLYLNGDVILSNVSSFFIHTHFLLITTLQHVLLCIELTESGITAIAEYQKTESNHVYKRKIERGAKLVIAVPNDTRTIFQMPRGNLENIQPRPLSLKIIGKYLNQLKYYQAFDLMRKQRINLNLIHDHNPKKFFMFIDFFLDDIENDSWLSLFLSDLENLDVTKTMYASSYADKTSKLNIDYNSKIHRVCDIIRSHLLKRFDKDRKILTLITTFVKKNTDEDLEAALDVVKQLKLKESGGSKLPVGSDEALKYLLYMVDVNQLFHVALGMYDFDLVLLVANKSQKDPKEYIPMLNELNDMEENYKKFSINKHLKRFSRAVEFLVKCGPEKHDELRTFVKYHSLYIDALALFTPEEDIYKQISDDFGLYLKLKKQFIRAGVMYERARSHEKAIECYKEALEWELAIKLGHKLPADQFRQLCNDLVNGLKEEKRFDEALNILEKYCDDKEDAISFAIEKSQYKTAMRLCSQFNRDDLKVEKLLPAVLEEYTNLRDLVESNWHTFIKYKERLSIVRKKKRKNPIEHYDPAFDNKDSDLYSDAGSTVASSRGSTRSFQSSKNRRKHERKVASLKEGSQYEDVALVMALHSLVTSSYELRSTVKKVNIALSCFDKDKEAFILQTSLEKLLKGMKDSFKEIWTNELILEATNAAIAAQNVPEGAHVILQGIATLEPHIRIAPVIQDFNWQLEGLN